MIRRTRLLMFSLAILASAMACGSEPTVEYSVRSVASTETNQLQDATLVTGVDLLVEEGAAPVEGARLKYAVSAGTLSASTGTSNGAGFASVAWTIAPGGFGRDNEATFFACAENQSPPTCTPTAVLFVAVNGQNGPIKRVIAR